MVPGEMHRERASKASLFGTRRSGILFHLTSLPGPHGAGDLGAVDPLVEFLVSANQSIWQILPIGPLGFGNSPYSAQSAFAGNPLFISLEALVEAGLLGRAELQELVSAAGPFPRDRVDYVKTVALRKAALSLAHSAFKQRDAHTQRDFEAFCDRHRKWLFDYTLFAALKRAHGGVPWTKFPPEIRARKRSALKAAESKLKPEIRELMFHQYLFEKQWAAFRSRLSRSGILLFGDIPIFVAHDSADVWTHPELFDLDKGGEPRVVAGVPPDYFSSTGQRWGNPLYAWREHRRTHYGWWRERLASGFDHLDAIRLDHFIGFHRAWAIPRDQKTAKFGKWKRGPSTHFFRSIERSLGPLPLIAEDLGVVTPEVIRLRDQFGFPGIKILEFAFGMDPTANSFLPHNYCKETVAYTGTHDNNTVQGWFHGERGGLSTRSQAQIALEAQNACLYLRGNAESIHWDMIRCLLFSSANTAMFPLQDVLGLGGEARMNTPGTLENNWEWRVLEEALTDSAAERLGALTRLSGRTHLEPFPRLAEAQS